LKVTTIADDVRLAYACAANELPGYGRELVTRLYARRLIQRLNEIIGDSELPHVSERLALSAEDTSTLVWSLGQLGARHWQERERGQGSGYKKLRLASNVPLLSETHLQSLSSRSLARLLHGTVSMEMMSSSPETVVSVLQALFAKAETEFANVELCDLAECLAKVKRSTRELQGTALFPSEESVNSTQSEVSERNNTESLEQDQEAIIEGMTQHSAVVRSMLTSTVDML